MLRFVAPTMTAQIRDYDAVDWCKGSDVALEDEGGACEAMKLVILACD